MTYICTPLTQGLLGQAPPPPAALVKAIRLLAGEIYQPECLLCIKSDSSKGSQPSFAVFQFFLSHSRHMGWMRVDKTAKIVMGIATVVKIRLQMVAEFHFCKSECN